MSSFIGWALRRNPDPIEEVSIETLEKNNNNNNNNNPTPLSSSSSSNPSSSSSSSYYPSIVPSSAPSDIDRMKEENIRLRAALEAIKKNNKDGKNNGNNIIDGYSFEHLGSIPGANGFLLSIPSNNPSAPPAFSSSSSSSSSSSASLSNESLWTHLPSSSKPIPTNPFSLPSSTVSSSSPNTMATASSTVSSPIDCHGRIGANEVLLTPDDAATVIVKSENEGEVALLDLSEIDWYVMVNNDGSTNDNNNNNNHIDCSDSSSSSPDCSTTKIRARIDRRGKYSGSPEDKIIDSELIGDDEGYLFIDHDDYIIALSDFISRSIQKRFPEAEQIPPDQLQKILGSAFKPLRPPSRFGKAVSWANFFYHSYSWGTTAFTIYREGVYAKLVLRGAMKAAQWLLVVLL